jgi:hypothetical protein
MTRKDRRRVGWLAINKKVPGLRERGEPWRPLCVCARYSDAFDSSCAAQRCGLPGSIPFLQAPVGDLDAPGEPNFGKTLDVLDKLVDDFGSERNA